MSKKIPAEIACRSCGNKFKVTLYRTIWIEYPENRELIFKNKINAVTCPSCNQTTRLEYPFLCTNVRKMIAVWYEPYHDPQIDKDMVEYLTMPGMSFYAKAPRISDWQRFKEKIVELEKQNSDCEGKVSGEVRSQLSKYYAKNDSMKPTTSTQQTASHKKGLSRNKRIFITFTVGWSAWVFLRTAQNFEIFGVRYRHWDRDMFFVHLAVPIALVWGAYILFNWIKSAEK